MREPTYLRPGCTPHEESPDVLLEETGWTNSSEKPAVGKRGMPQVQGVCTNNPGARLSWQQLETGGEAG